MAKYRAEIEVPDNADCQAIEEAMATAEWRRIYSRHERMERTDLTDKCGSCKYFRPIHKYYLGSGTESLCHGSCEKMKASDSRTNPKCKEYERKDG